MAQRLSREDGKGGDREAQRIRIHPGSASRPDYLCTKNAEVVDFGLRKLTVSFLKDLKWGLK